MLSNESRRAGQFVAAKYSLPPTSEDLRHSRSGNILETTQSCESLKTVAKKKLFVLVCLKCSERLAHQLPAHFPLLLRRQLSVADDVDDTIAEH